MSLHRVLSIIVLLLLAGCVRPQKEEPHAALIDPTTLGLTGPAAPRPDENWWQSFGDPQLNRLIEDALARNPSLEEALARVRAASAQTLGAQAAIRPSISIDADETWQRFSQNYYIPPPFAGNRYWAGQSGFNLDWSLDFWGRQGALIRQARAGQIGAGLEQISARLALAGSIAQAYLDLHRAYASSDIAARTLEQCEHLLKLTQQRASAGLDTAIETKIAEARVLDARNAQRQIDSERALAVHRLASLSAHGADYYAQIGRPRLALETILPIPQSLPIDLLSRRPDVLAARARIDAADAGRVAAKAAFYPDLSLRAFAGFQAIGLDTLLKSGSVIYGVGPAFHLPVFEAQRLRAGYKGATANLDAAIASYDDVVLNAVRQTADQITLGSSLGAQIIDAQASLTAAQGAYDLAQRRYAAGLATQITVLNAESQLLMTRQNIVALETHLAIARVTLLLTLGGSFNPEATK